MGRHNRQEAAKDGRGREAHGENDAGGSGESGGGIRRAGEGQGDVGGRASPFYIFLTV